MLLALIKILIGFVFLVWSADRLVAGSAAIAKNLNISPLLIGLTIVAFGTCAPEIIVSIIATLNHNNGIAIGNAVGSNIANMGLVLGFCALLKPLTMEKVTVDIEIPVMAGISFFIATLLIFFHLNPIVGVVCLLTIIIYTLWLYFRGKKQQVSKVQIHEYEQEIPQKMSMKMASFWAIVGLIILPISAQILVDGAVFVAHALGVSDLVIGLTLIALGTSLPELAASLVSIYKAEHGIALGNIIGSNVFNLTAVLCFPMLASGQHPKEIDPQAFSRDIPVMLLLTVVLTVLAFHYKKRKEIPFTGGLILFSSYLAYMGIIFFTAI